MHPSSPSTDQIGRMLSSLTGGATGDLFRDAVMSARDGIVIATVAPGVREHPITFANPGFERLTGYNQAEILGRDCRFLQLDDRDQPEVQIIRDAIHAGRDCLVTLRNYRKDGSMFWNELSLAPMRGPDGRVWRYVGIQKDVTARMQDGQHPTG
ncbi:PAS domain-containing protein [Lysobacter korlensis]|uniref:PAS domain-containing protein n=1 Tax=Lysobacter korlensis TaxID=553636 RepID=A0ABV6RRQ2_9GAMM